MVCFGRKCVTDSFRPVRERILLKKVLARQWNAIKATPAATIVLKHPAPRRRVFASLRREDSAKRQDTKPSLGAPNCRV